jgi:hypothetical protein
MTTVELLPSRRLFMIDERGDALRATWHPERRSVVLSHWKSDQCRATYQLDLAETTRLINFLVGTLAASAGHTPERDFPPSRSTAARTWLRDRVETLRARLHDGG